MSNSWIHRIDAIRFHSAARMIEDDLEDAYLTCREKYGAEVAGVLLVALLRQQLNDKKDQWPPPGQLYGQFRRFRFVPPKQCSQSCCQSRPHQKKSTIHHLHPQSRISVPNSQVWESVLNVHPLMILDPNNDSQHEFCPKQISHIGIGFLKPSHFEDRY